jgi:hypothetical protein
MIRVPHVAVGQLHLELLKVRQTGTLDIAISYPKTPPTGWLRARASSSLLPVQSTFFDRVVRPQDTFRSYDPSIHRDALLFRTGCLLFNQSQQCCLTVLSWPQLRFCFANRHSTLPSYACFMW